MIRWYFLAAFLVAVLGYHAYAVHEAYVQGKADCELANTLAHEKAQTEINTTAPDQNAKVATTIAAHKAAIKTAKANAPAIVLPASCNAPADVVRDVNAAR